MTTVTTPIGSVLDNRIVKSNNTIFDYLGSSDILLSQGQRNGNYIYYKDVSGEFVVSTDGKVALGDQCGRLQGDASIAIGDRAGLTGQNDFCVAIGFESGKQSQSKDAIAIGSYAAEINQGLDAVAIGLLSGNNSQGQSAVAIGNEAGQASQGISAVAVGEDAGNDNQGQSAVAIGLLSGSTSQGTNAIAIGNSAGLVAQGSNAIAIGHNAATLNQPSQSIIINATGSVLNSLVASSCTINPIAQKASGSTFNMLLYNDTTKEVVKSSAATSAFNKTFVIEHPKDESKYLVHACLEGPEAGVYYRGKAEIVYDHTVIALPDYLDKLATDFTVNLTPIYSNFYREVSNPECRHLCCEEVKDNKLVVHGPPCKFYWTVFGKRKDIQVEVSKDDSELKGDGPYTYLDKIHSVLRSEAKPRSGLVPLNERVNQKQEVVEEECIQSRLKTSTEIQCASKQEVIEECKQEIILEQEPKLRRTKPIRRVLVNQ